MATTTSWLSWTTSLSSLKPIYPIPDQEASTVAEVLVQHWISRFGVPLQLLSDQGRNFDSAVCKRLCEILAIDKTRTTALHPQSDGMVERFNRTILNSLSLLVSGNQQDWDKKLPFFLPAYRSAVHETTGYFPSQMLFGRALRLPADLLFSQPPDTPLAPEEYIEKLQARMEEMHHLARYRIGMASEKMKTRYDARATGHDIHEGDKVWLWNPKRRKGLSPKLHTNWEGPYTVLKRLNDVMVRIQKSPHSKPKLLRPLKIFNTHVEAKACKLHCGLQVKTCREGYQNREAARFFNADESNIRLWRKNKTNFKNCDRRKRADRRGKPQWPELEEEINGF
ncbi:retrovirus-related Pol polyprotein from transposon 412 [Trichonephila clavipes]|nr:retrovirus-related Pol polyprotein from transposon 412 [Trichonephila clavipes]